MRSRIPSLDKALVACSPLLSGILLILAFPKYDRGWLAWVALVPLLLGITGRGPKKSFLLVFAFGAIFIHGAFSWIFEVPGYRLVHHAMLLSFMSVYFGLFGFINSHITKRGGVTLGFVSAPFVWVTLEYVRSNLGFLSLPWALLGHSQYAHPMLIQFASFTGVYGISFLIMMTNATLTGIIWKCLGREGSAVLALKTPSGTSLGLMVVVTTVAMSAAALHGRTALSNPSMGKGVRVSVIQGNIEQDKKWDPKHAGFIMERHIELSRKAALDKPALIAWPEAATPGFVLKNMKLLNQTISLIRETETSYLIGSAEYPKFPKRPIVFGRGGNTAVFFSPEGKVLGQYMKTRLVPFKEYVPYEDSIPWPDFIVSRTKQGSSIAGEEFSLFELDGVKFGAIICWESLFPDLFRGFVKRGAQFVLNISSEAWFGDSAFPYQFLAISIFRAVENRTPIARAANTGVSCFVDAFGRITDKVESEGKELFVRGYLTREIHVNGNRTFYTRYGDLFAYAAIVTTVLLIGIALAIQKKPGERGL